MGKIVINDVLINSLTCGFYFIGERSVAKAVQLNVQSDY